MHHPGAIAYQGTLRWIVFLLFGLAAVAGGLLLISVVISETSRFVGGLLPDSHSGRRRAVLGIALAALIIGFLAYGWLHGSPAPGCSPDPMDGC